MHPVKHIPRVQFGPDSPMSLLLIVNLISHSSFISQWSLLHAKNYCCATSGDVSLYTSTSSFLKENVHCLSVKLLPCYQIPSCIISLVACEAASAHHAILVPALKKRFNVSSIPHFLPTLSGLAHSDFLSLSLYTCRAARNLNLYLQSNIKV